MGSSAWMSALYYSINTYTLSKYYLYFVHILLILFVEKMFMSYDQKSKLLIRQMNKKQ